jgi:tRNA-uridine 2-sulfurtransferase
MKTALHRVVVGLSGGVDSAVSAYLLKKAGHEVIGIFMKNWEGDDDDTYCSANADFVDAAAVADVLGIELEHVNFSAEYKDRVFATFLREYRAGRTPNPDVLCNAEIKFKAFLDHAMRLGAEQIATGHYARVRERAGRFELLKGLDTLKDQSYFLYRLNQAQLARTCFPVGEWVKTEVRRLALEIGLPNAGKKDSTGICFIGERPFREFLSQYLSHEPGPICDENDRVLGEHVGLSFYTLGQRKGIGIGGVKGCDGVSNAANYQGQGLHAPWFVARKDMTRNRLYVVQGHDHPWLQSSVLCACDVSWVNEDPASPLQSIAGLAQDLLDPHGKSSGADAAIGGLADSPRPLNAKTRYRQTDAPCRLSILDNHFTLQFDLPQWAVTPGQSAVLYDKEICLGGGVIDQTPEIAW